MESHERMQEERAMHTNLVLQSSHQNVNKQN